MRTELAFQANAAGWMRGARYRQEQTLGDSELNYRATGMGGKTA